MIQIEVLEALARSVGAQRAQEMLTQLNEELTAGQVRYTPGLPLMIEGVDCSPEHVRQLQAHINDWKRAALER